MVDRMKIGIYFGLLIATALSVTRSIAVERPVTGREIPRYAAFDDVVIAHMDLVGARAASLAIASERSIVYSRGFGWSDEAQSVPTEPDSLFRIASCTKPVTAAIVKNLIQGRRLKASAPVFEYLGIDPYKGELGDDRLGHITIQHLLDHKAGWDKELTYDPTYRLTKISQLLQLDGPITPTNLIAYMLSQPLQTAPGEKRAYSNFGYLVLGRVIEKATGASYSDVVQSMIAGPLGISDFSISPRDPSDRDPREVFYPQESGLDLQFRDSFGGLCSSAPSMCTFLDRYWINGDRRNPRKSRHYHQGGSHPRSTNCLMEQRSDGIHYVVLFNSRRGKQHNEDRDVLRLAMNQTINAIKGE
jgi:CubicO group peptidase (beta-lactamase class C family)